ncbi:MAG: 30S ribosomal protein S1 [Armatimonadota bacterium]
MSDDRLDQKRRHTPIHELSETPFGGRISRPEQGSEPERAAPEQQATQEQAPAPQEPEVPSERAPESEAQAEPTMEAAVAEMGAAGVDYSGTFKSLKAGDVVDGVVVHIDREGVLVDVGTKSEGTIKPSELTRDPSLSPEEVVSVGESIKVYVVEPESQEGGPVLSKKRADFENAWDRVEKAYAEGGILKAMVTDRVKGGLVVDLGIRGFVPASHVGSGKVKNLEKYVGQSLPFKVIEVDRDRRKVVLSNRLAVEEEQRELRKRTLASLAEGQVREGIVRRITDYGAFVDLGGVDGLLHISEMSWTRINHPTEAVRVGQKINVMVLKLNLEQGRVSLGLRQILPDPWEEAKRLYSVGDVVTGTVSRLVPFGAFVQVEGGIEGIIPNSELAHRRVNNPEDVVSVGQSVEVKVIDMRPDERRLTLSLRQLQAQRERERDQAEYREYTQSRAEAGKTTIGDLIGEKLDDFRFAVEEPEKPARKKSRAKGSKRRVDEEAEALAEAEEEEMLAAEIEAEVATEEPAAAESEAVQVVTEEPQGFTVAEAVGELQPEALSEEKKSRKRTTRKTKTEPAAEEAPHAEPAESPDTERSSVSQASSDEES